LMGDLNQSKRLSVINEMKAGKLDILVATDVAARGLHIEDLDLVINYDLPDDCENYVHRIGRTARAGKSGKAVSLACEKFVYNLPAIESFIGMKIPVLWPDSSIFAEDGSAHLNISAERYAKRTDAKRRRITTPVPRAKKEPAPTPKKHTPRQEQKPAEPAAGQKAVKPPGKSSNIDERLEYYRRKYGEDFQLKEEKTSSRPGSSTGSPKEGQKKKPETSGEKVEKPSGRIASLFRRKRRS